MNNSFKKLAWHFYVTAELLYINMGILSDMRILYHLLKRYLCNSSVLKIIILWFACLSMDTTLNLKLLVLLSKQVKHKSSIYQHHMDINMHVNMELLCFTCFDKRTNNFKFNVVSMLKHANQSIIIFKTDELFISQYLKSKKYYINLE
jgi:hypothetical protein